MTEQHRLEPDSVVLEQIRGLILDGRLKPGAKIPSERRLVEEYGVSRGYVRQALQKLEFYGIVKTLPKSGTVVAKLGGKALAWLISSIELISERDDIESLIETRAVLETHSARMAALRGSRKDVAEIRRCQRDFERIAADGRQAIEEDHLFHLAIARASKNDVALSLLSLITPDIIALNRDFHEKDPRRFENTVVEHRAVADAIGRKDPDEAEGAMRRHMDMSRNRRLGGIERNRANRGKRTR